MKNKSLPLPLIVLVASGGCYQTVRADTGALINAAPPTSAKLTSSPSSFNKSKLHLQPTLVGVFVNGEEQETLDVLYDPDYRSGQPPLNAEVDNLNDHYYLSVSDVSRLTGISFTAIADGASKPLASTETRTDIDDNNTDNLNIDNLNIDNIKRYDINTPIGNTQLAAHEFRAYQGQHYLALSMLKKLGITATYSQPDLAIHINMGWLPKPIKGNLPSNTADESLPIDYWPDRAGLLTLSLDSSIAISEESNGQHNRQMHSTLGASGYGLGGVWGINASGSDNSSVKTDNASQRDRIKDTNLDRTIANEHSVMPWDWQDWQIDNLYWAKSGEQFAGRLGTNQPRSLGQGAQLSSTGFTGALIAYSNHNITRHLNQFDDTSRSLLQNTNQDLQHLTGIGEAGGVAELRINGRSLARVQIGLDGRYEFLNLDVDKLDLSESIVEIAIYAYPLARQPLEVRPIILSKRRTNVATDELLIEAGLGRSGNLLNDNHHFEDSDTLTHLYAEYGLTNRLALRGGAMYRIDNNNQNSSPLQHRGSDVSWFLGANVSPSWLNNHANYTNADFSYAHNTNDDIWLAQLDYQRKNFWLNYRYQGRKYQANQLNTLLPTDHPIDDLSNEDIHAADRWRTDHRHQLLLNYQPNKATRISFNQYYIDQDRNGDNTTADNYYSYTSINHNFSDSVNAGISWNSRDDRYNYRLLWQDNRRYRTNTINNQPNKWLSKNSLGLTGDNDSDTLSIRHQLNDQTSISQSFSYIHGNNDLLYQGDITHQFNSFGDDDGILSKSAAINNLFSLGYSLYDNHFGWQADWQLTHQNGVRLSVGYDHRYLSSIPINKTNHFNGADPDAFDRPWLRENFLYAKLSFDLFKAPRQPLRLGRYTPQRKGSIIIDLEHPTSPAIDSSNISFQLNNQKMQANLLNQQETSSQYIINGITAGDYTLTLDAKNLPLEYSTTALPTPKVRVNNHTPTSVPIVLQKTFGISGKLADSKKGIVIDIYQKGTVVQSVTTGPYGYFQIFGLLPDEYTLKAAGYQDQPVTISNDFVMNLSLNKL